MFRFGSSTTSRTIPILSNSCPAGQAIKKFFVWRLIPKQLYVVITEMLSTNNYFTCKNGKDRNNKLRQFSYCIIPLSFYRNTYYLLMYYLLCDKLYSKASCTNQREMQWIILLISKMLSSVIPLNYSLLRNVQRKLYFVYNYVIMSECNSYNPLQQIRLTVLCSNVCMYLLVTVYDTNASAFTKTIQISHKILIEK